ncbi:unnamed protein product [Bursaphelenchus xylophilus]|uniref:(pine wood nematode) hypothetical protein n=1 Tax=Bursaphelenchus xylophilus TaxID=6326 RepID=A0A1I7SX72_BURXY|nr:unnamed protein product [Bursaphelenchus xylophilus]CAG9100227.1 unnamed protein product [Bursaphelenchus xylophilus]
MWFQAKTLEFALAEFKENPTDADVQNRFLSLLRQNFQRLLHPMENQPVSSNQQFGQDKIGQPVEVGNGQKIVLTAEIYQDALSMQEHFKLDFVVALDLILCGESQKKQYNDISRGLCAVLCYYDAHRSFLCTTRSILTLIEDGVCPEYLSPEFQKFVNDIYSNNNLFDNCLKAFEILEKRTDFDRIYQFGFLRIVDDIEAEIYEVVCLLSLNCPASQQKIRLPALFKSAKQMDFDPKGLTDSFKAGIRKSVRLPELTVWTGITLFVSPAKIRAADSSCDEIFEIFEQNLKEHWAHLPLKASIQFFYAIAVKCTVGTFSRRDRLNAQDPIDQAIDHRCLHFIQQRLFQVPNIYRYNSSIEVIDKCIKDFIVYCPERVQQMFSICEEEVIIMDDPDLHKLHDLKDFPLNFKVLLNIIREIYEGDTDLVRNLSQQFFDPNFQLSNFIVCGVSISASTLYVDYVYMLKALCKSRQAAQFIYEHFNQGGESLFDWANLFGTLRQYVNEFHRSSMAYTNPHITAPAFQPLSHAIRMNSEELSGMVCWIRLATKIAELEPRSRRYFVLDNHFNAVETIILGVMTRFPLILKGHLYKFLAVLAKDEGSTVQLWTQLKLHGVCDYNEQARKLVGIQTELEEVESGENSYDSTEGFLHLVKSLFSRKNLTQTDLKTIVPYVKFTIKSVICQYDQRGYKNKLQMWNMVSTALDALFELLRRFHISSVSVAREGPQVSVLSQLLHDSDLSRAILRIIYECSNTLEETITILSRDDKSPQYLLAEARNEAALSALRLLSHACAVYQTVRAALRMAPENSRIFIVSLESILLTPLPTSPVVNYVHILNSFVEQQDSMLKHTFYVIRILSELCEQLTADANRTLLETFISSSRLVPIFARLISITGNEMIVDDNDLVPFDLEDVTEPRLRGEIARDLLNIYSKVLIAHPSECSFVHLLFGFNLKNIEESDMSVIGAEGATLNSTVSLVEILEHLAFSPKPESASFVILYESALRVLLKFAAVGSISSIPMLSFLRNGCDNLIRRLARSKIFLEVQNETLIHLEEPIFNSTAISLDHTTPRLNKVIDQDTVIESLKRLARGLILELIAVDFSVAMNLGHTDTGREYLEILLSNKDSDQAEHGLVWSLILNSISASLEIHTPRYNKFDMRKVDDVLDLCLRRSPISVDQYDVEYVRFLLEQELAAIVNDDVSDFQDDANQIVLYCVQYNAQRRLEGSCVQLLSGWIALVNAILYFSPLPFIPIETQQQFCTDALTLLKEYVQKVEMNEEVLGGVSNCCFVLVRELVKFTTVQYSSEVDRKLALGDVLNMLVSCAVLPTYNRHSQFKMNIYSSILCVIQSCTEETFKNDKKLVDQWHATGRFLNEPTESQADKQTSLIGLINEKSRVDEIWVAVFEEHAAALVQSTAGDIEFAPFKHKVLAISTLSEMLKEDRFGKNSIANHVVRLGVVKTLLDLLPRITDLDFKSGNATTNRDNLTLFHVILCFLIRLTNSTTGFKTLAECNALHRIASLTLWQNPPRDVFFLPVNGESEIKNGTPQLYLKCVRSLFRLCEAAASTIYKTSALDGIEECVSVQTELLNHLKRQCENEKDHPLVKTALLLLEFVHNLKESYRQVPTTN